MPPEPVASSERLDDLLASVVSAFLRKGDSPLARELSTPDAFTVSAKTTVGASALADRIASELQIELPLKQALPELADPVNRLEKLMTYLYCFQAVWLI